jgi:small subunit ribosomal protein S18
MSDQINPTAEETVTPAAPAAPVVVQKPAAPAPAPRGRTYPANNTQPTDSDERVSPGEYAPNDDGGRRRAGYGLKVAEISYKNVALLTRFMDPRGRILSRRKTRASAKGQRAVVKAIKQARHLALLPYTSDQTRITRKRR